MQKDSGPLRPLRSVLSLLAGLVFSSLAGLGAYQLSQDPWNIWVFLILSLKKCMPIGLITGASLLMVTKLGISMLNRLHQ
ncbi:unnamed protein product [Nyctereutes procyonoides]|uniref:(raccoon dog) hypothetical protein n=1 Tax=Nyctereutes procyonoides TaxID=34880 RepID=A0A811Z452_NYCPR|nr:unnamed protein product [Nyctereutes procyonoides]